MQALRRLFWLSTVFNFHITACYLPGMENVIADAFFRLHSTKHLLHAFSVLVEPYDWPVSYLLLAKLGDHMPYASSLFLTCRYRGA